MEDLILAQHRSQGASPRTAGLLTAHLKALSVAHCLWEHLKARSTCVAADLGGGSSSPMLHATPSIMPFLNSHHSSLGEHVLGLLQACRKNLQNVMICCYAHTVNLTPADKQFLNRTCWFIIVFPICVFLSLSLSFSHT